MESSDSGLLSENESDSSSVDSFEEDEFPLTSLRLSQKRSTKTAVISKVVTSLFQSKEQANEGVDEDAIYRL